MNNWHSGSHNVWVGWQSGIPLSKVEFVLVWMHKQCKKLNINNKFDEQIEPGSNNYYRFHFQINLKMWKRPYRNH
tara:strand:+ start:1251 stop:1475 length:225 start_codon:yes stop_codon:yes gene_type:complete